MRLLGLCWRHLAHIHRALMEWTIASSQASNSLSMMSLKKIGMGTIAISETAEQIDKFVQIISQWI